MTRQDSEMGRNMVAVARKNLPVQKTIAGKPTLQACISKEKFS
jgi:hypothetical protein